MYSFTYFILCGPLYEMANEQTCHNICGIVTVTSAIHVRFYWFSLCYVASTEQSENYKFVHILTHLNVAVKPDGKMAVYKYLELV
jgi:hypothetical protein